MRGVPSFHQRYPDVRALRIALAAGAVAGLVAIAACTDNGGSSSSITAPTAISKATTFSGGYAYSGKVLLCVNGQTTTFSAKYDSVGQHPAYGVSVLNNYPTSGGWPNHALNFIGGPPSPVSPYVAAGTVTAGTCSEIYTASAKANTGDPDTDAFAAIDVKIDTPAGATLVSTDCDIDSGLVNPDGTPYASGDFAPDCNNDGDGTVWSNFFHGSRITFTFSVPSTAIIAPTATTCAEYRDGHASVEPGISVGLKSGVINNAAPGVFFFYAHVNTTGLGPKTIGFNQTITSSAGLSYLYAVQQGQAYLYNQSCSVVATFPLNADGTLSSGLSMPAANYILGIKFTTDAAKGNTPSSTPTPLATHHYWATLTGVNQGSTSAQINTNVK